MFAGRARFSLPFVVAFCMSACTSVGDYSAPPTAPPDGASAAGWLHVEGSPVAADAPMTIRVVNRTGEIVVASEIQRGERIVAQFALMPATYELRADCSAPFVAEANT